MKILFNKEGKYENLIVLPEGTHYAVTVETEDDDKQLILQTGQSRFVLESTKEICQKSRGANTALATDMFNEIVYYISQLPEGLDLLDITNIQSRVRNSYEDAWKQLETCLVNWNIEKCEEKQNHNVLKAPYIFAKVIGFLTEKLGTGIEDWFCETEVALKDGNLHFFIKSPLCREVIKRRFSSYMKECLLEMGLDNMEIVFVDNEGNEDV